MYKQPIVSIIIATYNSGRTIRHTLESVRLQTFKDWECIIVDGLSKDNTIEIVNEYVNLDKRFNYVSEKDRGIYDAFNKGWRLAKGMWVSYLGSDDWLTEESFSNMKLTDLDDCVAVVSGAAYIVKSNKSIVVQNSVGWNGCHQAKLTRRSVLEQVGGFDENYRILADKDLYIRLRNMNFQVVNCSDVVAYFCMDGVSQKINTLWSRYKENIKIYSMDKNERHPYQKSLKILIISLLSRIKSKFFL